ncbi:MAG: type II toxin-antitoxin system VapC family toxin [Cellvibrio sp.]|nr:type II toxin-antitoxin system VapC family toxin [Cellvibrio sp.]
MIGLDTNILVRYFAQDDEKQSTLANERIEQLTIEDPGFITLVCIVELVWVLKSCYQADRNQIAIILDQLLHTQEFIIENMETVFHALKLYSSINADFADCLIDRSAKAAGCSETITFDKTAAALVGMKLLGS